LTSVNKLGCASFAALILLGVFVGLLSPGCIGKLTAPEPPPPPSDNNAKFITCSPSSGGTGTIVAITIAIIGNLQQIEAFGMDLSFDPAIFQYQDMSRGNLTGDWAEVNGNVTTPGLLIVGGFKRAGCDQLQSHLCGGR